MPASAEVPLEPTPSKEALYLLRGETVSVGGAVEWCIHQLATKFASSIEWDTGRQWDDVKREIQRRGLNAGLQRELAALAMYASARNAAAHTYVILLPGPSKVLRFNRRRPEEEVTAVPMTEIRQELTDVREAYEAVKRVGRALDEHDPSVLSGWNVVRRIALTGSV